METVAFKGTDDPGREDSTARQAALRTVHELCRLEGVPLSKTFLDFLIRARESLAAVAQPERVRAERDLLEAEQKTSHKELSTAAEVLHDAIRSVSRQQHELTDLHNQANGLLSGTASVSAGFRACGDRLRQRKPVVSVQTSRPITEPACIPLPCGSNCESCGIS